MSVEEIKKLQNRRTNLATKIKEWKSKGKNARELAVRYEELTNKLRDIGKNVHISAECLTVEYWDKFYLNVQPINTGTIKECKIKSEKEYVAHKDIEKEIDDKIKDINYYSICLAWECKDIQESPNHIGVIKNCFNDLGLKEISDEYYQMGSCVEHMTKYRFIGDDNSFNIVKTFAQSALDSITNLDDNKNNASIFGKKINI